MSFSIDRYTELTQVTTYQDVSLGIMRWGENNAFPQSLKNFIEQSPNAKPAVSRTAKFYRGADFEGSDCIVHPTGLTLGNLVEFLSNDLAYYDGFSIHANYNLPGKVTTIAPLGMEMLRLQELDELSFASKIAYHPNFGNNSEVKMTSTSAYIDSSKIKWFHRFNPDPEMVNNQIKSVGGTSKYPGQILYCSNSGFSSYPIPTLQAQINFLLADVENSILTRKETATGFISSYLLKTMLSAEDPNLIALENSIAQAQGARGVGKVITLSGLSQEEMQGTVLEEIGSGGSGASTIMDAVGKTFDLCRKTIIGAYLIPPILAGADQATGFTTDELEDAYRVFNAVTQGGRDKIQAEINRVLAVGDFKVKEIKLEKLTLENDPEAPKKGEEDASK